MTLRDRLACYAVHEPSCSTNSPKPEARHCNCGLAEVLAKLRKRDDLQELAALSVDSDSMDRDSEVDIWGFHSEPDLRNTSEGEEDG